MQFKYLIMLSFFFTAIAHAASPLNNDVQQSERKKSFYNDRERGWYWYEDSTEDEEKEVLKPQIQVSTPVQPVLSPREILKQQGEQWEDALATAILEPSKENYQNYLAMTAQIQQQSQEFATGLKLLLSSCSGTKPMEVALDQKNATSSSKDVNLSAAQYDLRCSRLRRFDNQLFR